MKTSAATTAPAMLAGITRAESATADSLATPATACTSWEPGFRRSPPKEAPRISAAPATAAGRPLARSRGTRIGPSAAAVLAWLGTAMFTK